MPSRLIREGILTSDRVDALDFASEVFYRRLMSKVDDHGLFDARTSVLRASLYPLRVDRVREADISRWIAMCEKAGLIALYHHDGKPYLRMLDTRWPARSDPKYPMPTEGDVANSCKQSPASAHLDVVVGGVVVVDKAHDRQADPFGEFWELYPKKVGKKPAREKWKAKKLDRIAEAILVDVEDRLKLDSRWREGYIPNPATYLTQERWQDDWRTPVATPSGVPSGKPKGPSETPLERAVSYARQQFHYGQIDEAERDRLITEATAKHRGEVMNGVQFIEFGAWAQRLGRLPTIEEIAARYPQRHRTWHYRMRDRLLEAWDIPRSPNCYLRTALAPRRAA